MPSALSLAIDAPASALGRSTKVEEAGELQVALVAGVADRAPGAGRDGDGDDAGAVGEEPLQRRVGSRRDVDAAGEDRLGRALGDQRRRAVGAPRRATRRQLALVVERQHRRAARSRRPSAAAAMRRRGADHSATSSALPPTGPVARHRRLVAHQPEQERRRRRLPRGVERPSKVIAPSVSVPVLSVNSTSMLPRSSMRDQALDEHPLAGPAPRAGGRG